MGCSVSGAINGNNRFRTATAELMRYVCLYLRARGENREEALRLSTLASSCCPEFVVLGKGAVLAREMDTRKSASRSHVLALEGHSK